MNQNPDARSKLILSADDLSRLPRILSQISTTTKSSSSSNRPEFSHEYAQQISTCPQHPFLFKLPQISSFFLPCIVNFPRTFLLRGKRLSFRCSADVNLEHARVRMEWPAVALSEAVLINNYIELTLGASRLLFPMLFCPIELSSSFGIPIS